MHLLTAAADLLLGAQCPGCGRAATALCAACTRAVAPAPREVPGQTVTTVAAGEHTGVLRAAVVAWKEKGQESLLDPLALLLAAAVGALPLRGPVVLVPVPASRRSRRLRGADLVDDLADAAAARLAAVGVDATVRQATRVARRTRDQSGLGARDRASNLHGAFGARRGVDLGARDVLVVDDVVTTGATLGEAVRALRAVGVRPVAAAVVASRPLGG